MNVILFGADIQPEAEIRGPCFIGHTSGIVIGKNVFIEEGCIIFQGVTITPGLHPGLELGPEDCIHVGRNVKFYAGAKILGNLTIGSEVTIGANAVVLASLPNGVTAAGVPARVVSDRGVVGD